MKLLTGKTALVTGAARGIGKAIALKFAAEGANIAFTDLQVNEETEKEIAALGVKVKSYASNAADFAQTEEVVKAVKEEFGAIDILVNNAGITKDGLMLRMTEQQWDAVIAVNLKSAFNFIHACVPVMMRQRGGSIINMASVVGVHGNAGQANYAASKAYCEKGNINKMIGRMTEEEAWKLLRDTSSALDFLHTRTPPIIHQDIKPANILVANDGIYMLTDFGVSTSLKATLSRLSIDEQSLMSAGTLAYMDPQKFSRKNLPIMANDIWSLGATVFEMLTGELPFGNSGGLLQKKGADVPDLPDHFSPLLNDTLRSCMDEDPAKRPWASKLNEIAIDAIKNPKGADAVENGSQKVAVQSTPHVSPVLEKPVEVNKSQPISKGYLRTWFIVITILAGIAVGVLLALLL